MLWRCDFFGVGDDDDDDGDGNDNDMQVNIFPQPLGGPLCVVVLFLFLVFFLAFSCLFLSFLCFSVSTFFCFVQPYLTLSRFTLFSFSLSARVCICVSGLLMLCLLVCAFAYPCVFACFMLC